MKHMMSVIIYNGMDGAKVYRKEWHLPDLSVEEYDPKKHSGKIFMHPDGNMPTPEGMYVWQWCTPENSEEEAKLIAMGKIHPPVILGTHGNKKELLYKTHDNWFVYEKDTYPTYKVCSDFSIIQFAACDANPVGSNAKYFHNENTAKEYVLMNKPILSIKDVEDYLNTVKTVSPTNSYIKELKRIVIERELARLKTGSADR